MSAFSGNVTHEADPWARPEQIMAIATTDRFVSRNRAAVLMGGIDPRTAGRVLASGNVRTRQLPGTPVRYHEGDIMALLEKATSGDRACSAAG